MGPSEWAAQHAAEVVTLLRDSSMAFWVFFKLLLQLIMAILRPLTILLRPVFLQTFSFAWRRFSAQSTRAIVLQIGVACFLLLLTWLEHRFGFGARALRLWRRARYNTSQRYNKIFNSVQRQSKLAATALPHVIFVALAALIERAVSPLIAPSIRAPLVLVVACARPALRSVALLYALEVAPLPGDTPAPVRKSLALTDNSSDGETKNSDQSSSNGHANGTGGAQDTPGSALGALSALRRRAGLVAERIANASGSSCDSADSGSDDDHSRHGTGLETPPSTALSFETAAVRTLPATGLGRVRGMYRGSRSASEERATRRSAEVDALQLWVVTGLILAVRALVRFLCPLMLANVLVRADVVLFYLCVWLQASFTGGFAIAYRALAVVTGTISPRREANGIGDAKRAQLGMAFGLLVSFGMMTQETADAVSHTLAESGVTLVGAVFLITPYVVTFAGTVVIGSLAPAYLTASALQVESGAADRRRNWLTYWAVYAVSDAVISVLAPVLEWVPLFYHLKMVLILWLQLPYFRGAAVVLHATLTRIVGIAGQVGKSTYTPRKLKLS